MKDANDDQKNVGRAMLNMVRDDFFLPYVRRIQPPPTVYRKFVFAFDVESLNGGNSFYDATSLFMDETWQGKDFMLKTYVSRLYGAHPNLALEFARSRYSLATSDEEKKKWETLIDRMEPMAKKLGPSGVPEHMSYVIESVRNHVKQNRQVVIACEYISILEKYRQLLQVNVPELQASETMSIVVFDAKRFKDSQTRKNLLDTFSERNSSIRVLLVSSTIGNAGYQLRFGL